MYIWYIYDASSGGIRFEWSHIKAVQNLRKHGVPFDEAMTIFEDESALLILDPDHSQDEERYILLGMSHRSRLLLVVHCYRERDAVIRIISARRATRMERRQYEQRSKS